MVKAVIEDPGALSNVSASVGAIAHNDGGAKVSRAQNRMESEEEKCEQHH